MRLLGILTQHLDDESKDGSPGSGGSSVFMVTPCSTMVESWTNESLYAYPKCIFIQFFFQPTGYRPSCQTPGVEMP
jgi:hypothetical protein